MALKPIRPRSYESPEQRSEHARKANRFRWARFREEDDRKAGPRQDDEKHRKSPASKPGGWEPNEETRRSQDERWPAAR
jgi:hypothetical protein